jgi:FkbM family methyltransferase
MISRMNLIRAFRYARSYRNWAELTRIRDAGEKPRHAEMRIGLSFEGPPDVNVLRSVGAGFLKQRYTPPGFEIAPRDVVVDVGANIGAFSIFAAQRTRERVIAIEPFPTNAEYLRRNADANAANVEVLEIALCDLDGSVEFVVTPNGTTHRMRASSDAEDVTRVVVRGMTLRALMESLGLDHIDLLKLDCEGAEGHILPSCSEETLSRVRRIAMEFHDATSPLNHVELEQLLVKRGFETRLDWDGIASTGFLYASRA